MQRRIGPVTVEVVEGNIAAQGDVDAVVNAANAQLRIGGGVAGAIHRAAGPQLEQACRPFAPIEPGKAVLTEAFNLPNRFVIHCLGPVYGVDVPSDRFLRDCYRNALRLAEGRRIESVAFPSISTGAFGYPMEEAASIAFETVLDAAPDLKQVRLIRFVLFGKDSLDLHQRVLEELLAEG